MTTGALEQTRPATADALPARQMLIGGQWCGAVAGETLVVENPGRRPPICTVPRARAQDVNRAVEAAAAAFPGWSRVPARDRGRALQRIADELESRQEELARLDRRGDWQRATHPGPRRGKVCGRLIPLFRRASKRVAGHHPAARSRHAQLHTA